MTPETRPARMLGSCAGRRFREEVRNEQETTHAGADHHGDVLVGVGPELEAKDRRTLELPHLVARRDADLDPPVLEFGKVPAMEVVGIAGSGARTVGCVEDPHQGWLAVARHGNGVGRLGQVGHSAGRLTRGRCLGGRLCFVLLRAAGDRRGKKQNEELEGRSAQEPPPCCSLTDPIVQRPSGCLSVGYETPS